MVVQWNLMDDLPSGELSHFAMERSTIVLWENPLFLWAFSNCKLLVHQRVIINHQAVAQNNMNNHFFL